MSKLGELKKKASRYSASFGGPMPLSDEENRSRKAAKIRAVLAAEGAFDRPAPAVLDIGCSFGIILKRITPANSIGVGIDMDEAFGCEGKNLVFVRADAENLPLRDDSFDIVICNHVYEHTDDPDRLVGEIWRVLKADGVCYFAGPNKYDPIEPHYGLPFLSWLPRPAADFYMRLSGKGDTYPERPWSLPRLRELFADFEVQEYTGRILSDPLRYDATDILQPGTLKQRVALAIYRYARFFFPGFVVVLRRRL